MEHLSRRTTQDVDALLIVARADLISVRSAGRISELAERLKLRVKEKYLLINDVPEPGELPPALERELGRLGLPLLGLIPHDEEVLRLALAGRPLAELPSDSPAKRALARILETMGELQSDDRQS